MEKYHLKFHVTINDLFNSSMNAINKSKKHYLNVIFTLASFLLLIYLFISNSINNLEIYRLIVLILCAILFPIIQPLIIYIKLYMNYKKYPLKDIELIVYDNYLTVSNFTEKENVYLNTLNDIKKYNNMIIIMYDSIHGQIIPNIAFNDSIIDKDEFYNFIKSKINK